jgi:hypothetical protein
VYSAVAYMRNDTDTGVKLRFVQARSCLRPIKAAFTIPRMELLAAEMGLALAKKLTATLSFRHQDIHLWTDSRAVHDWLRVESRALQVFVKNRVLKIRQYLRLDQIMWVPGLMNPADAATRGLTVEKLKVTTNWLEGPEFLTKERGSWPEQPPEPGQELANILPETISGLKRIKHGHIGELLLTSSLQFCLFSAAPARDDYYEPKEPSLLKISNWSKLVRIVAYCRRLMTKKTGKCHPWKKWRQNAQLSITASKQHIEQRCFN